MRIIRTDIPVYTILRQFNISQFSLVDFPISVHVKYKDPDENKRLIAENELMAIITDPLKGTKN